METVEKQTNDDLARRLTHGCQTTCTDENCDAMQAAMRLRSYREPMRKILEAAINVKPGPTIEDRMREAAESIIDRPVKVSFGHDSQWYILSAHLGAYRINFGAVNAIQCDRDILRDVTVLCNSAKLTGAIR